MQKIIADDALFLRLKSAMTITFYARETKLYFFMESILNANPKKGDKFNKLFDISVIYAEII